MIRQFRLVGRVVGAFLVVGCPSDDATVAGDGSSSSSSSTTSSSTTSSTTTSSTTTTTSPDSSSSETETSLTDASSSGPGESSSSDADSTSGGSAESSSSSEGSASGSSSSESGETGNPGGLPNGEMCDDDDQCASDSCFVVGPLGGICGECEVDADCDDGGCSIPLFLEEPVEGAVCNDGSMGDGCDSDAACAGALVCQAILDLPGVITNETCGECINDMDCGPAEVCSPAYDVGAIGGAWICAGEGSLPVGAGCRLGGFGPFACSSGTCTPADLLGITEIGVCGSCMFDNDCFNGETCQPAEVDLEGGLSGSFCGP